MAFVSLYTDRYQMPYFSNGDFYSAEADKVRFVTVDNQISSYVGVVGVGVITGWVVSGIGALTVTVSAGAGFLNGYYSESGWVVKRHQDVLPTDVVLQAGYYTDPVSGQVYDKVLYKFRITLQNNADNYVYAYRNSNYLYTTPYMEPDNENPVAETTAEPRKTAVAFDVAGTLREATSSGRALVALVVTRGNAISVIDTSLVDSIENLTYTISDLGQSAITAHRHGGSHAWDPATVNLTTDRRNTILLSATDTSVTYTAELPNPTSAYEGHKHQVSIDSAGDGITTTLIGSGDFHFHEIDAFQVGSPLGADVADHTHELDMASADSDGWGTSDPVQIYINGEAYEGQNATVNATAKQVVFTADVTVRKRKFSINDLREGRRFVFEAEEKSLYRFMLRASIAYYDQYRDGINDGTVPLIILPDSTTPATVLQNQALVGEGRLAVVGDTFTFVGDAADNVLVTLVQTDHIDEVEIEILSNTEITGVLPQGNILYVPAEKITTGILDVGVIPLLSHLGRFLELALPPRVRARSEDARIYSTDRTYPYGDARVVYSAANDNYGTYVLGTSDGLLVYPAQGAFLFKVNGVEVVTAYGDVRDRLEEAALGYAADGNKILVIDSIYDDQIEEAATEVATVGTHYRFVGRRNPDVEGEVDTIDLFHVPGYRLPHFGYTTTRSASEIKDGEDIVEQISVPAVETDSTTGEEEVVSENQYIVTRNLHKSVVKRVLANVGTPVSYGLSAVSYVTMSSRYVATTGAMGTEWQIPLSDDDLGYGYELAVDYGGHLWAASSSGLWVSPTLSAKTMQQLSLPVFDNEVRGLAIGYMGLVLCSIWGRIFRTTDMGGAWSSVRLSSADVTKIFWDPYEDRTSLVAAHRHNLHVDQQGNGETSGQFDISGHSVTPVHVHSVVEGEIQAENGHTHVGVRTFYALDTLWYVWQSTDGGLSWSRYARLPIAYTEYGVVFSTHGALYASIDGAFQKTTNGASWTTVLLADTNVHSASWDIDNELVLMGGENVLYSFDGTDVETVVSLAGAPVPQVFMGGVARKFGWSFNNLSYEYDFGGSLFYGTAIDVVDDFSVYTAEHEGWSDGTPYDLYVEDRLVKTTKDGVRILSPVPVTVNNTEGTVDFTVDGALGVDVEYGATTLTLASTADFPTSGEIVIGLSASDVTEGETPFVDSVVFFRYSGKTSALLLLTEPSLNEVPKARVAFLKLMSPYGGETDVRLTIYESKLLNVGRRTHTQIEDGLSREEIGLGKRMADVYLHNLLSLTSAVKSVFPTIDSEMDNWYITLFNYNNTPGDPNNIDRWIDRSLSNILSLSLHQSPFNVQTAAFVYKILPGFGQYADTLFAATNIGLFVMTNATSLEPNWYRHDIEGATAVYDILQTSAGQFFVATDLGFYRNISGSLSRWTLYDDAAVGGLPVTRIVPRWTDVTDEEHPIDYWWGGWTGTINTGNEDLVNSILLSGSGFSSVSDDYGDSWQRSDFYSDAGTVLSGAYILSSYRLLRNGSMAATLNMSDSSSSGLYVASNTGVTWQQKTLFSQIAATVSSVALSQQANTILTLDFGETDLPPTRSLIGRRLSVSGTLYPIVNNSSNIVTVEGSGAYSTTAGVSVSILPPLLNSVFETSERHLLIGADMGVLTDGGVYRSQNRTRNGVVIGLGNHGTIGQVGITGVVQSALQRGANYVLTVTTSSNIVSDQFATQLLRFVSLPDATVVSNTKTRFDGTAVVTVTSSQSIPAGSNFSVVGETVRVAIAFDGPVAASQLVGGYLFPEPAPGEEGIVRAAAIKFLISANGTTWVEVPRPATPTEETAAESTTAEADPFTYLFAGGGVYASNGDGTVPVYVTFDEDHEKGELAGMSIVVEPVGALTSDSTLPIVTNDEASLLLSELVSVESSALGGGTETREYSVYNLLFANTEFSLKDTAFRRMESFSDAQSTVVSDHWHDVSMATSPITGTVSGFSANTASSIRLTVTDTRNLSNAFVQAHPTLFQGQTMLVYNPGNRALSYRVTVLSHGANYIEVAKGEDIFNLTGGDTSKISAGFLFILSVKSYGITDGISYSPDYIVHVSYITADAYVGGTQLTVADALQFNVGDRVEVTSSLGEAMASTVAAVTAPNIVTIADGLLFNLAAEEGSQLRSKYTLIAGGTSLLTANALAGATHILVVDSSIAAVGDELSLTDSRGQMQNLIVSAVPTATRVNFASALRGDFLVANAAQAQAFAPNIRATHTHMIRNGEFVRYLDETEVRNFRTAYHAHILAPLVGSVLDINRVNGIVYVVGTGTRIVSTVDNGDTWQIELELDDLPELRAGTRGVTGVFTDGTNVLFPTSNGQVVYLSPMNNRRLTLLQLPLD